MDAIYPIGKFQFSGKVTEEAVRQWVSEIEQLPGLVKQATQILTEQQLQQSYREGGWSLLKVVHHLVDTHLNAYVRTKLMLTADKPAVTTYNEILWAEQEDYNMPLESALVFLESIHERWTHILKRLSYADFEKVYVHPVAGEVSLAETVAKYAWHGQHHLGQITTFCERQGWTCQELKSR